MNLIEIAEDLKDVPDQYLMQEIQQPTGNFPAYLVVSELSRRKRMRDKVVKEMPSQTVAQELATPPQMAPQMDPQMASQGLMAMPQAQTELAAQDAMGTTPTEMMMPTQTMAGGGIVSFRDGGDVQRFQNQGLVEATSPFGRFMGYDTTRRLQEEQRLRDQIRNQFGMAAGPLGFFKTQTDEERAKAQDIIGRLNTMSLEELKALSGQTESPTASPRAAPASPAADPAGAPPAPPPGGAPEEAPAVGSTFRDQISQILSREPPAPPMAMASSAGLPAFSSAKELGDARARKIAEFEQAVPDRATPFFQEDISRREKDIEGRRDSNINQALIRAGLGIAKKGVIAGAGEGLDSYQQGEKDIRQSREAMFAARAKMIDSQTLRDQGKFGAGKEARLEAKEDYDRALSLFNTQDSQNFRQAQLASSNYGNQLTAFGNQQRSGLEALRLRREAEQDPIKNRLLEAQIKQAEAAAEASRRLKIADLTTINNIKTQVQNSQNVSSDEYKNNPARKRQVDEEVAKLLRDQGFVVPGVAQELNRGNLP